MNFPRFLAHQVIRLYNIYFYIVWHDSFGKLRTGLVVVLLSLHKHWDITFIRHETISMFLGPS